MNILQTRTTERERSLESDLRAILALTKDVLTAMDSETGLRFTPEFRAEWMRASLKHIDKIAKDSLGIETKSWTEL